MASIVNTARTPKPFLHPELVLRQRLQSQLVVFICLELPFITLALVCLVHPVPCNISPSSTLTKATFTVFFIAWQTVAVMCVRGINLHVFSSEWYFRYQKRGELILGYTDAVSTTTSGFRDQLQCFFSRSASSAYRLSYVTSWVLVALAGFAPSAINVDDVKRFDDAIIEVTNFTATSGDIDGNLKAPIVRTGLISNLELRQNTSFGFTTPEHVVIGWPNIDAGQLDGDIEFESDTWFYNYTCLWEAPTFNLSRWNTTWYAGGFAWYPWTTPDPGTVFDGGLMPMYRFSTDQPFRSDNFPLILTGADPIGLSGFVFFGRNSSFPDIPSTKSTLNMDNLPTIFSPSGFHFIDFDGSDGHFKSPLASFLLCDPQAFLHDGHLLLSQLNTSVTLQTSTKPVNSSPRVGNIPPGAANFVLGLSQMDTLETDDESDRIRAGALASKAFLNDTSLDFEDPQPYQFDVGILPLEEIQENLNRFMRSGAKAMSSYLRDYDLLPPGPPFLVSVDGNIQGDAQVLVGSLGFVIATICLFCVTAVASAYSLYSLRTWNIPAFKLETLLRVVQEQATGSSEKSPLHPNYSVYPSIPHPSPQHFGLQKHIGRLLGFLVLEVLFFSLVFVCAEHPIIVDTDLMSAEVKGSFTLLFILWQVSALFLLADATSFAYSAEWSLQRTKTGLLVPGETDRVSVLTSGNEDKTRYFFTRKPSSMFRVAFLISIILAFLNFFAPGTLSVGQVTAAIDTSLRVANLRLITSSQGDDNENNSDFLQNRADTLSFLEQHEEFTFRYDVEPSWIMAWPDEGSISSDIIRTLEYPTDVIHFNYSCAWILPEMGSDHNATTWSINNQTWKLFSDPLSQFLYVGGILPLYRYIDVQPDGRFATLIVGTNDSFPIDPDKNKRSILNLNNIPTQYHPSGLTLNNTDGVPSNWTSPLTTVLYCDPQIEVSGGRAQLSSSKSLKVTTSGLPLFGNIPHDAVTTLFTSALLIAFDTSDETDSPWIGTQSAQAFLSDPSQNFDAYPRGVPLNNLTTLNANFNIYMSSASKAFLDGLYVNPTNQSNITAQTDTVTGRGEVALQGLRGDRTLGIVALCLTFASTVLFGTLVRLLLVNNGEAFTLKHLLPFLYMGKSESFLCLE